MLGTKTALVTFEGIDGSGKSTQSAMTRDYLEIHGSSVLPLREPGGTPIGEEIRNLLLHSAEMTGKTEVLLFVAARAESYQTVIRQAIGEYDFVLLDRGIDSSVVYQGFARELPVEEVKWLNRFATDGITPDVTYLLDIEASLSMSRINGPLDRIEQEGLAFQEKLRAGFLELAEEEPERFVVIDSSQSPEECFRMVRRDLYCRFSEY